MTKIQCARGKPSQDRIRFLFRPLSLATAVLWFWMDCEQSVILHVFLSILRQVVVFKGNIPKSKRGKNKRKSAQKPSTFLLIPALFDLFHALQIQDSLCPL